MQFDLDAYARDAAEETFNLRRVLEEPVPYLLRNDERCLDPNFHFFWFSLSIGCCALNQANMLFPVVTAANDGVVWRCFQVPPTNTHPEDTAVVPFEFFPRGGFFYSCPARSVCRCYRDAMRCGVSTKMHGCACE